MEYTIIPETFASIEAYRKDSANGLRWDPLFVLPAWLDIWWQTLHSGSELLLTSVRLADRLTGVAPLQSKDATASFIGDTDVCDYQDFIVAQGKENEFYTALLDDLKAKHMTRLDLAHVRPESSVLTYLAGFARERGDEVSVKQEAVSLEVGLPPEWEQYLSLLTTKQRHELRRKLRRLEENGAVNYRVVQDKAGINSQMDGFLKLFTGSRDDKAMFLTPERESFFRKMASAMSDVRLSRLGVLEVDKTIAAMLFYFDYHGTVYLYNSGYDPQYSFLSAGLISKSLCIKDSIEKGMKKFDFLKGDEIYKTHLGGKEVPLYRCEIGIS